VLTFKRKRSFYVSWFLLLAVIILSAGCASVIRYVDLSNELAHQMGPASVGRGAEFIELAPTYNPII